MLDLKLGDELLFETPVAFLLQTDLWEMVQHSGPAGHGCAGHTDLFLRLFLDDYLLQARHPARRRQVQFALPARLPQGHRHGSRDGRQRAVPPLAAGCRLRFRLRRTGAAGQSARQRHQPHRAGAHAATRRQRRTRQTGAQHELARHHRLCHSIYRADGHRDGHHPRLPGSRRRWAPPA